jgi:hypothetical protein
MTRFDALARAACAVQLDVYGSAARSSYGGAPAGPTGRARRIRTGR